MHWAKYALMVDELLSISCFPTQYSLLQVQRKLPAIFLSQFILDYPLYLHMEDISFKFIVYTDILTIHLEAAFTQFKENYLFWYLNKVTRKFPIWFRTHLGAVVQGLKAIATNGASRLVTCSEPFILKWKQILNY